MTWTVEAMKLRPVLGIILGSHFWPPKQLIFRFPVKKHHTQNRIWGRLMVTLGSSGIVLASSWGVVLVSF